MDTALIVITLLSVGLTGALLVYATRLQREQREREDARVLALAREINGPGPDPMMPLRRDATAIEPVRPWPRHDSFAHRDAPPVMEPDVPLNLAEPPAIASPSPLFGAPEQEAATLPRFAAPLVGVAVVSLVLGGVYFFNARPAASPLTPAAKAAAPATAGALELVSLDQARSGRTLTVHGVVKNPASAASQHGLAAVVFVFDKSGAFVTSARAPIDYQLLAPGDESPFTVSVPNVADVARYRVSFRNARDVLPHVDRRKH